MIRLLLLPVYCMFILLLTQCNMASADDTHTAVADDNTYQCVPCGQDCDKKLLKEPGDCTSCGMKLVKSNTVGFKTIEPAALCQYIKDHTGVILLDVRTKGEFEGKADPDFGTLRNAINIPIQQLGNRLGELAQYKTKEIIVYCSHSHRSPQASYLLTQNGFTNVTNMAGGMSIMKDKDCVK